MIVATENPYQKLRELKGSTNAEIVAALPARYFFWKDGSHFTNRLDESVGLPTMCKMLGRQKLMFLEQPR